MEEFNTVMCQFIPKLSVVTVVRNDLVGLQRTAESVFSQKYRDFEWLICDGDSGLETTNFLRSLGARVSWLSEPDQGIYDAMHKGLQLARGEWVLFLNAGDIFVDFDVVDYINSHVDCADVYFYSCMMFGLGVEYLRRPRPLSSASYSVPAVQQATVYKRDVLLRLDWPTGYRVCGDFAIAAQLLKMGALSMCDDRVVAKFELGGVSTIRPMALAIEAYQIQSQILKLPVLVRVFHFTRRLLTGYFVLVSYRMRSLINRFRVISNA